MSSANSDRIVPTALTSLWRGPSRRLEPGDGVVVFPAEGRSMHGTVIDAGDPERTIVRTPDRTVTGPVDWEM